MKKKKKEINDQELKVPKDFKEKIGLIKNFPPKKTISEKQNEYVWSVAC